MLTHYCVAQNQPRLVATSISEDASKATFTFLDGGNMPSRDTGHMDMLEITFHEDGSVVKQWHWYQNGKQAPMEQITLTRPTAETPAEKPAEDAEPHAHH